MNQYGPTETAMGATIWVQRAGKVRGGKRRSGGDRHQLRTREMYVLDEGMEPVPVGVEGEMYIGGEGVGRGYWSRAE